MHDPDDRLLAPEAGGLPPPAQGDDRPDAEHLLDGASPAQADAQPPTATPPPRRALKLVVSLLAGADGGGRALLALGADGCDPQLRAVLAPDLYAALDEVPALLADAEARWQEAPRYPATRRLARASAPSPGPRGTPPATNRRPAPPATEPLEGQMNLFG